MPNARPIALPENPTAAQCRINLTSTAVNLDVPQASPRGEAQRPLAPLSRMFSACVPRNRCAGLTHGGLSQECRTQSPAGISP